MGVGARMVQTSAKMGTRLWWSGQMWATRPIREVMRPHGHTCTLVD